MSDDSTRLNREKVIVPCQDILACPIAAERKVLEILFEDAMLALNRDGGAFVKLELTRHIKPLDEHYTYTMQLTTQTAEKE